MSKLKIAIQKSGRLREDSMKLLKDCGIKVSNGMDRLKAEASNFPLEIYYLRNSDIPSCIEKGIVDVGIVGENLLVEQSPDLEVVRQLGFSKCRLSLAVPKDIDAFDLSFFNGKKIATSYPATLSSFLNENNISADIHTISGSVEIAPNIGIADAVCDLVSSGNTLFVNGLKETDVILTSEAVLVKGKGISAQASKTLDLMKFRMDAVLRAKNTKYLLMNVPDASIPEVSGLLPVLKSPTILPLEEEGWSSMHTVINEDDFWEVIEQLKNAGAQDILVAPIEKIIR